MRHTMHLAREPFKQIKNKSKVIESRLYDEKRKHITVGDEILFCPADADGADRNATQTCVLTEVKELLRYGSFAELFDAYDPALFGGSSKQTLLEQIRQFYSPKDETKYGVVGVRIKSIDIFLNVSKYTIVHSILTN